MIVCDSRSLDFQDGSEEDLAGMWKRIAFSSIDRCEQLQAFQNAIEALAVSRLSE